MNRSEQLARTRKVLAERGPEIAARYAAGESSRSLAEELGITNATVIRAIRANGGETRGRNPGVRKGREVVAAKGSEIAAEYEAGGYLADVAAKYDISISTAAKVVRAHGGQVRHKGFGARPTRGASNPAWKGGTTIHNGYRLIKADAGSPFASMSGKNGYIPEHRLVMAEMIKRPLSPDETVHHIDGDPLNNHPDNLQLRQGRHGTGSHWRCGDCGSQNVVPREL